MIVGNAMFPLPWMSGEKHQVCHFIEMAKELSIRIYGKHLQLIFYLQSIRDCVCSDGRERNMKPVFQSTDNDLN